MISFKQFLRENDDPKDAREFFHRECKPFIDKAQGAGVFVRGVQGRPTTFARITLPSGKETDVMRVAVRKDRLPLDTPKFIHDISDEWMKSQFGISGRSGSVFVFGDKRIDYAEDYGTAYAVIPQGDFKFLWSPKVSDMHNYHEENEFYDKFYDVPKDELHGMVVKELESMGYQDTDLPAAIRSGNEVMIDCTHILLIRTEDYKILKDLKAVLS